MSNLQEIQHKYPASELLLATAEADYIEELKGLLEAYHIRGQVISYRTEKPDYARSRVWNTVCGREAMRRYMLSHTSADYMLCLDSDMTYDTDVVEILVGEIQGCSLVHSGYPLRHYGVGLSGTGCTMLTRDVLEKLSFRCHEFKNGHIIPEDLMLEVDMFRIRSKSRRGFFLSICHYIDEKEAKCITRRPVGLLRRISNAPLLRYILIRISICLGYNITMELKYIYNRLVGSPSAINPVRATMEDD
jgi:hypothetical protein